MTRTAAPADFTKPQQRLLALIESRPAIWIVDPGALPRWGQRILIYDNADPRWETWTTQSVLDSLACLGVLPAHVFDHQGHTVAYFDYDSEPTISSASYTPGPRLSGRDGDILYTRIA